MKKILLCLMALATVVTIYSCKSPNDGVCRIQGFVNGEQYEGKRIFLVPFSGYLFENIFPKSTLVSSFPQKTVFTSFSNNNFSLMRTSKSIIYGLPA